MTPKIREARSHSFRFTAAPKMLIGETLSQDYSHVYTPLSKELVKRCGSVTLSTGSEIKVESQSILIGLASDHPSLAQLIDDLPPTAQMQMHREGYVLDVTPERILLTALKPAGIFYGTQALIKRIDAGGATLTVECGQIVDWPTMPRRGLHFLVKSRAELADFKSVITEFMPRFRLNELILEINYHYEYQSHPEVREEHAWTAGDCRALKRLADAHGVKIIPMINCLGHQSWADETFQLLKAHPEFDETPDIPLDNKEIYCRSWCPLHPEVNPFIFDLIDELVDVFDAQSFHAGMDEVFILGRCPRCREYEPAELFARSVKDIRAHVVEERKLEMLIWGDRLLDTAATGYGEWEASNNRTAAAIDLIPKDIVICDWHYETSYQGIPATYPSIREFQKRGFRVWPAGWKSAENAQLLTGAAMETASDCIVGYLATTWSTIGLVTGGLRGDAACLAENFVAGIVDAITEGSRIAWEGVTGARDEEESSVGGSVLTSNHAGDTEAADGGMREQADAPPRTVDPALT